MLTGRARQVMRLLSDEGGFTLTELLVVSILMLVVLAGIYNIFGAGQSYYNTIEGQNVAVQGSSRSMYQLVKELRGALDIQSSLPGYGPLTPGPYQVALRTDVDDDGQMEIVAFRVDDSMRLVRYINEPNTSTYSTAILATHVRNRANDVALFTYYDSTRTALSDPSLIPAKTTSVRVNIVTDKDPGLPPPAMSLTTTIRRRNLPSG